ncbi:MULTISPECIES: hypothetical protein [Snodgrassella]|uniref:hypothetical protein n=1 Tax=Snodgrassella TaxID=1193515 RepID=UPI000815ED42|nr:MULTISPECIES: hypothetical protein [Snodgrassella]SCC08626.1 hypothetical protein GA0061082_10890 [Snodgrassella sp. R-53583]
MIEVTKAKKIETKASEIKYPVARKSKHNGEVVLFYGEKSGVVVEAGDPRKSRNSVGTISENWTSYTDENTWEPVDAHIYG